MARIRIIKKNDEITGTWYGGVHITGKSGIPVSLDKDEYMELDTEPEPDDEENKEPDEENAEPGGETAGEKTGERALKRDIRAGDIVRHFKREWVSQETSEYLYKVLAFAQHTETGERLVIYQALYAPFKICARPYAMFMSLVDREKYPDVKQTYRFEKLEV